MNPLRLFLLLSFLVLAICGGIYCAATAEATAPKAEGPTDSGDCVPCADDDQCGDYGVCIEGCCREEC